MIVVENILKFSKIFTRDYVAISGYSRNIRIYDSFAQLLDYLIYDKFLHCIDATDDMKNITIYANYTFHITREHPCGCYTNLIRVVGESAIDFDLALLHDHGRFTARICRNMISRFIPNVRVGDIYNIRVYIADSDTN